MRREGSFPPNLPEFIELCLPTTTSPDGKNTAAYINIDDPKHPNYQAKQIESDEHKSKRKDAGQSALSDMKDLF